MYRKRYGSIDAIASKTDSNCHLCHDPVDVGLYGPTGYFGDDTVTVDHLEPQAYGGDDDPDNLMIAHGRCNSIRGTRDVDLVRLELAGTTRAPMGASDKNAIAFAGGAAAALAAGAIFSEPQPDGSRRFNGEAALVTAGVVAFLRLLA